MNGWFLVVEHSEKTWMMTRGTPVHLENHHLNHGKLHTIC